MNAAPIAEVGGGIIVDDAQLSPEWITDTLLPVLLDPELVAAMSRAAAGAGRRDADRRLAAEVIDVMRGAGAGDAPRREDARQHGAGGAGGERPGRDGCARAGEGREEPDMGLVTPVTAVPVGQLGRVHFVGIGGAGMSGIARIMLARGVAVSGSDRAASAQLDELARLGATVRVGHDPANIDGADTVVTTPSAIGDRNPEIVAARQRGITVIPRAAALASLMLGRQGIAVTGTHGKTTTTSMLTTVLRHCGADPSYVIGGILAETGDGAGEGTGDGVRGRGGRERRVVPECCRRAPRWSPASRPSTWTTTRSLAQIEATFAAFAGQIRAGGLLVTCRDDPGAAALAAAAAAFPLRVRSYGESAEADYRVTGVTGLGMATRLTVTPRARGARGR